MQGWNRLVVNGQPLRRPRTPQPIRNFVPTPQEIKNFKVRAPPRTASFYGDRAKIVNVPVTKGKPFHLDLEFADGARKRVDIAAMYGGDFDVHPVYKKHMGSQERFRAVKFDPYSIY
jgi:hypothetical protein